MTNKNPYKLTAKDLKKRRGDRKCLALSALADVARQHEEDSNVEPTLTPPELAKAWKVHPTSAFRVLERLRKYKSVIRCGLGLKAQYSITEKGIKKLRFLSRH